MGGMKRKIEKMEKIEKKDSRAVAFSKRRKGLYSKTSELCLLSGAQVAILATPVSSKSNVSFYSFGHSSVDSVVSAFLANQRPREDLGLGFWWEDESLAKSENSSELRGAVDSISRMLQNLKGLHSAAVKKNHENMKKKDLVIHGTHQTLNLQSSAASNCFHDGPPASFEGFVKNSEEEDQIVATSHNNSLLGSLAGSNEELDLDQIFDYVTNYEEGTSANLEMDGVSTNQNPCSDPEAVEDGALVVHRDPDEYNNLHLYGCNQEVDLDQIFDFVTESEGTWTNQNPCSESEAVEDGALVIHGDPDEDNLHFSDFFDGLTSIAQL